MTVVSVDVVPHVLHRRAVKTVHAKIAVVLPSP